MDVRVHEAGKNREIPEVGVVGACGDFFGRNDGGDFFVFNEDGEVADLIGENDLPG